MDIRISLEGAAGDAEALGAWLNDDAALRGQLRVTAGPTAAGTMGSLTELAVAATAAASVLTALTQCLSAWLSQRRSSVTIRFAGASGQPVSVSVNRGTDPAELENLVRSALQAAGESPGDESQPTEGKGRHRAVTRP